MLRLLTVVALLGSAALPRALWAEGGPHYLLQRGPAPPALELALEEELPGARAAPGEPHAMRVILEASPASSGAGGWRLELRRPGGRLLLSRMIELTGGEEAGLRVVVFLCSRTLARFGPGDDVAPDALAELEPTAETPMPAPAPTGRRVGFALLATLPWWQQPARPRPGVALEVGVGADLLRLSVRLQAAPPQTITTTEVEARITDAQVAALLEIGLLQGVRGELGLGAAAGVQLGWTTARARFPAAPGSRGVASRFFDPAPWGQVTLDLAIDPGDPRIEILARGGITLHPLARRVILPELIGEERTGIEEGFLRPVIELGLRAVF